MEVRVGTKYAVALLLIVVGVLMRLLPHEPNFAPVGAIALFGGAVLGWRTALWLPLTIMAVSDMVLGSYPGIFFTWAGFAAVSLLGVLLSRRSLAVKIGLGAVGSALVFYVISNFGTWLVGGMYPATLQGLVACYTMALPFLRVSLMADLLYSTVFFGVHAFALWAVARRAKSRLPFVQ